ncbi:MAG: hypothetical protein RJA07_2676 [Bacteroidota bacterium]|jgi:hypothetical protein
MKSFILSLFFKEKPDELIGKWFPYNDGGMSMMSGMAIEFRDNSKGILYSWGSSSPDHEEGYDLEEEILWKRVSKNQIKIKMLDQENFDLVTYNIEKKYVGYYSLTSGFNGNDEYFKNCFWKVFNPIQKRIS